MTSDTSTCMHVCTVTWVATPGVFKNPASSFVMIGCVPRWKLQLNLLPLYLTHQQPMGHRQELCVASSKLKLLLKGYGHKTTVYREFFMWVLFFAECVTSLILPKIDTAKNKPYYTSSLRALEIAKIELRESLTHFEASFSPKFADAKNSRYTVIFVVCELWPWPWGYGIESRSWHTLGSWTSIVWYIIQIQHGSHTPFGHDNNCVKYPDPI